MAKKKVAATLVTKNIIINVYAKETVVDEITTGGFLGVIPMTDGRGVGTFRGKVYPVEVEVNSLGTVPPQKEYRGNKTVEADKIVNALNNMDFDRIEKLTEDEKDRLSAIGTIELHGVVVEALEAVPRIWTPFIDACQQADRELELPQYKEEPVYVEIQGRKAVGCDVRVDVNGARFLFGEGGFVQCSDGRDLYQFWTEAAVGIFPDGDLAYPND